VIVANLNSSISNFMDVTEFFQQSAGQWFSQRTHHHPASKPSESGKSDVQIEILSKDAPEVLQLCEQHAIDPALALCGVQASWSGMMNRDTSKRSGSTLLVPVAEPGKSNEGKLLRKSNSAQMAVSVSRYIMSADDVLTLITEDDEVYAEERIWFASPNLRLRTSVLKQSGGFRTSSFRSEIRLGVTKPAAG
jgi:hypothetical protein